MRFLKRLTIRLRWPAVVAAGVPILGTVCSMFWGCLFDVNLLGKYWLLGFGPTLVSLSQFDAALVDPGRPSPDLRVTGHPAFWTSIESWSDLFTFDIGKGTARGVDWNAVLPLWSLAFPPALLAFAGFRLKRREPKPGQCQRCGHPLAGAAVCPECGAPAPVTAA